MQIDRETDIDRQRDRYEQIEGQIQKERETDIDKQRERDIYRQREGQILIDRETDIDRQRDQNININNIFCKGEESSEFPPGINVVVNVGSQGQLYENIKL